MTRPVAAAQRIDLNTLPTTPWKNGAGTTREVARAAEGADGDDFGWRLSVAEVERDAPFSVFPGVDRCIVLLRGEGMELRAVDGALVQALRPMQPFSFPGDRPLSARLSAGPCTDFNAMTRRGRWRADVRVLHGAATVACGHDTLLLCAGGMWQVGDEALAPMHALLWRGLETPIAIAPKAGGAAAALLHVRLCQDPFR